MSDIRVRFAPSPTGTIHLGNMRTAIFNYLYARHHGGKFLLRVEDTDKERSTPEAEQRLFDAMEWLGLEYDHEGEEGFVRQSARFDAHMAAVEELLSKGLAYRSSQTTGEIGGKAGTASASGEAIWLKADAVDRTYDDLILGPQTQPAKQVKDFVIVRSNGQPMFILANTIDDRDMNVTHVLRGADHQTNTYRQLMIYEALGAQPPRFGHLPLIVDKNGKKLSKRADDPESIVFVHEFRERGYLPETLFNFLALLGWTPEPQQDEAGETVFREKLSRDELIAEFSLDRVRSSPAQFDLVKLGALNYRYILDRLETQADMLIDYVKNEARAAELDVNCLSDSQYDTLIREAGTRVRTLQELVPNNRFFFTQRVDVDTKPKAVRKAFRKEGVWDRVAAVADKLEQIEADEWRGERIMGAMHEAADAVAGGKLGDVAQPVRVLVTGTPASPGIDVTLELLGKDRTLARLRDEENRAALEQAVK